MYEETLRDYAVCIDPEGVLNFFLGTEFGPGTEFFEGMIGSENKVPGHKKVGARFPPKCPAPNLGLEPKPLSKICSEN